jgi:hypothetical protein
MKLRRPRVHQSATLQERLDYYADRSGGPEGCWPWTGALSRGYGKLRWGSRDCRASRLAFEAANGHIPAGACVLHRCDNPRCVNPAHLFAGSHLDNMRDMARKGRSRRPTGELNGSAKLTGERVLAIRAAKGTRREIAVRFGVTPPTISRIKLGNRWGHLPLADTPVMVDRPRGESLSGGFEPPGRLSVV